MKKIKLDQQKLQEIKLHKKLAKKYYRIREVNKYYKYFNKYWIEEIKLMLPRKKFNRALDLGCGTVEFYELVKDYMKSKYIGLDLSADMLEFGRKKYNKIKLIQGDAENLPFRKNSFDFVIGRGIIHHLPNSLKGMEEVYRVVRKGGYVLISEPHSNRVLSIFRKVYYRFSSHFSEVHKSFLEEEILSLFENVGFKIKKIKFWGILSFPFAFPDITPTYKIIPYGLFKYLVKIDRLLTKLPVIKQFSWHIIILAKKVKG